MTHTGSFLLKSTGFNIGNDIAIPSSGVHWKVRLFCADPDSGVVYAVISGIYSARYCTSPRNFWTSLKFWGILHSLIHHILSNLACMPLSSMTCPRQSVLSENKSSFDFDK